MYIVYTYMRFLSDYPKKILRPRRALTAKYSIICVGRSVTIIWRTADLIFTTHKTFSGSTSIMAVHRSRRAPLLIVQVSCDIYYRYNIIIFEWRSACIWFDLSYWQRFETEFRHLTQCNMKLDKIYFFVFAHNILYVDTLALIIYS